MKSKLVQEFNLPTYVKGKTFAEASKAIDKKFEDREDKFSQETKKELLSRLSQAQEHLKMKEAVASGAGSVNNQMFNGGVRPQVQGVNTLQPNGVQMDAAALPVGGDTSGLTAPGADVASGGGPGVGAMAQDAQTLLSFGQDAFGATGIDTTGAAGRQAQVDGAGWDAAGAGLKGAAAGAKYGGPIGAAAGAIIGAGSSLIGSGRKRKELTEANINASLVENNKFTNDFERGGVADKRDPIKGINSLVPNEYKYQDTTPIADPTITQMSTATPTFGQKLKMAGKDVADWSKENYGSILNTAPAVMNAAQLASLEKADGFSYDRLDGRYREHNIDERAIENKVQNEASNSIRALTNATNGSQGALRSNILGAQLQKTNALSDAYLKADRINAEENRFGQQFNAQRDAINQRTSMLETNERRADDASYGNAKSMLMGQLGENIGDFGKEANYKKMAIQATDYSWDGKYYVTKDGKKITATQYAKLKAAEETK